MVTFFNHANLKGIGLRTELNSIFLFRNELLHLVSQDHPDAAKSRIVALRLNLLYGTYRKDCFHQLSPH